MENLKEILTIVSIIFVVVVYYPYFRDIFLGITKPHLYTWLIWAVTMGIATAGALKGGAEQGAWPLAMGTMAITVITLLSLKYGTKNITKSDTVALVVSLGAVFVWWQLQSLYLAVLIATMIDVIGYYPTFRKSYLAPESETISFWALSTLGIAINIAALSEYNFLTTFYLATIFLFSGSLAIFLFFRRKQLGL